MTKQRLPLQPGEMPIEHAPNIELESGALCIPQHYLTYDHTRATVEAIILDIDFEPRYPIFVHEDAGGLSLQVGIIGYDNYKSIASQKNPKIVFGRKWRVERQLPTSEIIQTAFIALKKAREHEIRELIRLNHKGRVTTPFSHHHDLPLMAQNADMFLNTAQVQSMNETEMPEDSEAAINRLKHSLCALRYDTAKFTLQNIIKLSNGTWIAEAETIMTAEGQLPELMSATLTLILEDLTINTLFYALMAALIRLSDRYVDETFQYKGFTRFSRRNNVFAIAALSTNLRRPGQENQNFEKKLADTNYAIDKSRVPTLTDSNLSKKIRGLLDDYAPFSGIVPE